MRALRLFSAISVLTIAVSFIVISLPIHSKEVYVHRGGKLIVPNKTPAIAPEEYYQLGSQAMHEEKWKEAAKYFFLVSHYFPETTYGQEAFFHLGVACYEMKEFDAANEAFTSYLHCQTNPRYFLESIQNKFYIAEQFRAGARRRLLGSKQMPKLVLGKEMALEIYDEVIAALPNQEMAIKALFSKACLLWEQHDYRESVEAFQTLIRRFPKHELAPESYLLINKVYRDQCKNEYQNPDILSLVAINLRKFEEAFPREERLDTAKEDLLSVKEIYAQGLFETGVFYERINQPKAAVMYYHMAMTHFPETEIAKECRRYLARLDPKTFGRKKTPA